MTIVRDVLVPEREREWGTWRPFRDMDKLFEYAFDDTNLLMTVSLWPELWVGDNDYRYITDRMGEPFANLFRDEVELRSRMFRYAAIALCIRGDSNPINVRRKLKELGFSLDIEILIKEGIVELEKSEIAVDSTEEDGLVLTDKGRQLLRNVWKQINREEPDQLDEIGNLRSEKTLVLLNSIYNHVVECERYFHKREVERIEMEADLDHLFEIQFMPYKVETMMKEDWVNICLEYGVITRDDVKKQKVEKISARRLKEMFYKEILFDYKRYSVIWMSTYGSRRGTVDKEKMGMNHAFTGFRGHHIISAICGQTFIRGQLTDLDDDRGHCSKCVDKYDDMYRFRIDQLCGIMGKNLYELNRMYPEELEGFIRERLMDLKSTYLPSRTLITRKDCRRFFNIHRLAWNDDAKGYGSDGKVHRLGYAYGGYSPPLRIKCDDYEGNDYKFRPTLKPITCKCSHASDENNRKHIDSQSYFNLMREGYINPTNTSEIDGSEDIYVVGPNSFDLLNSKQFKYDWLDMDPEIRRIFSNQGVCPVGIENKQRCELTWKAGSTLSKMLHIDVDGLRIEISSTHQRVYFWPREGNRITYVRLADIYDEIKKISDGYRLKLSTIKFQDGFELVARDQFVEFNHSGSRFMSLAQVKKLLTESGMFDEEETPDNN